jgi:hypothetical protein
MDTNIYKKAPPPASHKGGGSGVGLRNGRMGGRDGRGVYEAYEVKNKRGKIRCLFLYWKISKHFFYIYDVITWGQKRKKLC